MSRQSVKRREAPREQPPNLSLAELAFYYNNNYFILLRAEWGGKRGRGGKGGVGWVRIKQP